MPQAEILGVGSRERLDLTEWNRRFAHDSSSARSVWLGHTALRRSALWRPPSFKRAVKVVSAMAAAPDHSLPDQHQDWADLRGAGDNDDLGAPRLTAN